VTSRIAATLLRDNYDNDSRDVQTAQKLPISYQRDQLYIDPSPSDVVDLFSLSLPFFLYSFLFLYDFSFRYEIKEKRIYPPRVAIRISESKRAKGAKE